MIKLFLTAFIFILCTGLANAQKNVTGSPVNGFSAGPELAFPIGLFGQVYSYGVGASIQKNFALDKKIALTIYGGYLSYSLKNTYGGGSNGYIPVLGGGEISFSNLIYASAQLGITFRTEGLGNAFTFSPGVGFNLSKHFTALLKYVGQTRSAINSSSVGLRGAYVFGK